MTNFNLRSLLFTGLAVGVSGCGLIDSDVTNFDLTLPAKSFTIDAMNWQVDQSAATAMLSTSCGSMPAACMTAAASACRTDCTGTCSSETSTCELHLDVSLFQPIDLVTEKPELKSINDEPVIKVEIDSVNYEVESNTLNVATPEMTVYVAPMSAMSPKDPQAKAIGVIPATPAGMTTSVPQMLQFTPTGRAELIAMMNNYKTPFNIIVGSSLTVSSSSMVPNGKLEAVVYIKAHAGL
ncbi:MAG: hypothetical protein SFX73_27755 [Kofleriaceae bacterium]|nr:hypothetical protein [Kofleriaceae bacterium]